MPRKGMRSVFFSSSPHKTPSSPSPSFSSSSFQKSPLRTTPSPYTNSPLRRRPRIQTPIFSFSESMMVETLVIAEQMTNKWNPDTSTYAKVTSLFYESKREAKDFIKCINDLQNLMHFLITEDPTSEKLVRAQNLMQIAMKRLQKEFYQILSTNRAHLDPESISSRSSITSRMSRSSVSDIEDDVEDEIQLAGNSITEVENASRLTMDDLKTIADCMISNGYGKECVKIYKIIRKSIVDEGLYRLGVERLNANRIHKLDWEVLELKHHHWINAVKIAVNTLFLGERILCDEVFDSSDSIRESCFSEITREGAMNLFLFPELVVMKSKKSSDKIFRLLEQYNAISGVWPDIELIFSFESTSAIHSQALSSLISLSDTIRSMLSEFESSIQKDSSKSPVIGGGIHPLTSNAMSYISHLADYSGILSNIISDWQLPVQTPMPESYFEIPNSDDPNSTISTRFAWLIFVLLCKLDGKAELYKDVALSYLFLANNLQFVVTNVRRSNLQFLLGEQWTSKQEAKVKQYTANYQRLGWSTVLSTIPKNPTTVTISSEEAKNYLKKFISAFEETYRSQSSWVVPDSKLRDEIKLSIYSNLLPTYRAFFDKYRIALRSERNSQALIKFTPDDLGNYISDLFYGTAISSSSSTTTTTSSSPSSTHSPRVMKLRLEPRRCFSF